MIAELKAAMKHGAVFVLSFPMPEDNGPYSGREDEGYGPGNHAHVYPGFLLRESFERFMMQMYFRLEFRMQNGSSAWYVFRNYAKDDMVDPFKMISGNYTPQALYGCLHAPEAFE